MKTTIVTLITFVISITLLSQEKRKPISGLVTVDSIAINDVHIINNNTKKGTISNDNGIFELPVKLGDTLYFSHLKLENKSIIINRDAIKLGKINIKLTEKIAQLNAFTLEKPKGIFYTDPTISTYKGPTVNAKTLKLPYANTVKKPNTAIVKLSSGGVLSIDNLINTLNGNKRRKRIVEKLAKEDRNLQKIRAFFTDDFFITDLHIKKEDINPFLNFCLKQNIITIFNKNENIKLTQILVSQSKKFPQKVNSEIKITLKEN